MSRSVSVKATKEGVGRLPWSLAMISIRSSLKIPTQEYVVPRSIPIDGELVGGRWWGPELFLGVDLPMAGAILM